MTNGNYVVISTYWDNGVVTDTGAVTWGDGTTGITGVVSTANSLVGSTTNDLIFIWPMMIALSDGNYVVRSPNWANGAASAAGAAIRQTATSSRVTIVLRFETRITHPLPPAPRRRRSTAPRCDP